MTWPLPSRNWSPQPVCAGRVEVDVHGQAGHLARQHLRFAVLEAGPEPGHTWRSRWDSLTLFTPAQYAALPGMPFPRIARHLPD